MRRYERLFFFLFTISVSHLSIFVLSTFEINKKRSKDSYFYCVLNSSLVIWNIIVTKFVHKRCLHESERATSFLNGRPPKRTGLYLVNSRRLIVGYMRRAILNKQPYLWSTCCKHSKLYIFKKSVFSWRLNNLSAHHLCYMLQLAVPICLPIIDAVKNRTMKGCLALLVGGTDQIHYRQGWVATRAIVVTLNTELFKWEVANL